MTSTDDLGPELATCDRSTKGILTGKREILKRKLPPRAGGDRVD